MAFSPPARHRLVRRPIYTRTACTGLALAGLLTGCSSSSTPDTSASSTAAGTASAATVATFTGAYSGTLTPSVCRNTVVDLVVHAGAGVSTGIIDDAFPADPAGTRYRITLYNLGKTGTVFAQAPKDPKYVLSSTDRNVFFLDGIVLLSNSSPKVELALHGSLTCS